MHWTLTTGDCVRTLSLGTAVLRHSPRLECRETKGSGEDVIRYNGPGRYECRKFEWMTSTCFLHTGVIRCRYENLHFVGYKPTAISSYCKPYKAECLFYAQPGLKFITSTFCPHSVFMCFVWIWEQTAIISLYSINWLVFITETECLLRGTFYILRSAHTVYLCVLCGSENKQRLFHCKTLTDRFL